MEDHGIGQARQHITCNAEAWWGGSVSPSIGMHVRIYIRINPSSQSRKAHAQAASIVEGMLQNSRQEAVQAVSTATDDLDWRLCVVNFRVSRWRTRERRIGRSDTCAFKDRALRRDPNRDLRREGSTPRSWTLWPDPSKLRFTDLCERSEAIMWDHLTIPRGAWIEPLHSRITTFEDFQIQIEIETETRA